MLKELKVKKAINGDEDCFLQLINENKEKLYRIAYSYVKNEHDALDIVQETVYKAYISIDTLQKPKYFNTWLTKILINISINFINQNKKTTYLEGQEELIVAKSENVEIKLDILEAIEKIDEKYKPIIILKYFDDLTIKEIAKVLEIPIGTAKTYLNRGLSSLRLILVEEEK